MKFNYQARTEKGEIQTGVVEASSRETALSLLKSYNLYVTYLEELSLPLYAKEIKFFKRISKKEMSLFSRQMAVMFTSGISLVETLQTAANQSKNQLFREKLFDIAEKVEGGMALSQSFGFHPEIFSPFYINMIKAGEISGKLSENFAYLSDYLEKEYHFVSKMRGVMIYPIFVLSVFLIITTVVVVFVIPKITGVLLETGQESLPLLTQILIGVSNFFQKWGLFLILIVFLLIIYLYYYFRTKKGKEFLDKNLLAIPWLGEFLKKIHLSRLANNFSTLIASGISITRALEITASVVGNETYKKIILQTNEEVKKGETINAVLQKYPKEFPPLFLQMVVVGEKTGTLDSSLKTLIDFYQKEIDRSLDNFIVIIEPVLIITLGLLVALLMAAVLLPLYQRFSF